MKKPTEKDRERIAAAVQRLFAFYTKGADTSAEKQQYVVSRCMCRLSDKAAQESARRDLDRFVLETIFLECISEATRVVHTPKHAREDHKDSYPGIFVDLVHADGERTMLSCIEYDSSENRLQAVSYGNAYSDEPTEITKFDHVYSDSEIEEKLKELIDKDVVTVMMQGSEKVKNPPLKL